jgi:hypothetical protein
MYQVSGETNNTNNFNPATSVALCDSGDIAFNGGADFNIAGHTEIGDFTSEPIFDPTIKADVGWFASITQPFAGGSHIISSTVTCLDNPPLR